MNKVTIWLKIGKLFIDQESIRELKRIGRQTQIKLLSNKIVIVNASYETVIEMLPSGRF
ncbi:MAG: hypothetical protein M3Q58_17210 [Bacteroidota bacterium]|nr:hypothetical protein [Bacteroidota bacterium]